MKRQLHGSDGDRGESKGKAAGLQLSLQNKLKIIIIIICRHDRSNVLHDLQQKSADD